MIRSPAIVRMFEAAEWATYRDLRLRALADSPDAFGSTLAAEQGRPDGEWVARLGAGVASGSDLPLIAQVDGHAAGLAWAKADGEKPSVVNLFQVWVVPNFRGQGLGDQLLRAAVKWATARSAHAIHLRVTCGDTPAMRLYMRHGFRPSGQCEPLRSGSTLLEQPMSLLLRDGG